MYRGPFLSTLRLSGHPRLQPAPLCTSAIYCNASDLCVYIRHAVKPLLIVTGYSDIKALTFVCSLPHAANGPH